MSSLEVSSNIIAHQIQELDSNIIETANKILNEINYNHKGYFVFLEKKHSITKNCFHNFNLSKN